MSSLKIYLRNLNVFDESSDTLTDEEKEHERRSNIISTRILLIALFVALIVLALFLKLRNQNIIETLQHPTADQLKNLPSDAHCPCSRISSFYGDFTSIEARFHQICSSDFISDRWIKTINSGSNSTYFYFSDFRTDGSAAFQALSSFCHLAKDNILQNIDSFNISSLITPEVLREDVFQSEINASIQQFQSLVPNEFSTQLLLIRKMILGNECLSGLQTNFRQSYYALANGWFTFVIYARDFTLNSTTTCHCSDNLECNQQSKIDNVF